MRKFIITVLAAGMVLSMSGCGSRENVSGTGESSDDMWTFRAVVKKIEDTTVLIEPVEGALNSSDSIRIGKEDLPESEDIKTGS